ncbi:hypothetical protein BBJ29_005656 [Phytophthora kernoviae]|uniref:SGNH hydrolase-type esterase domain-containing protein n=1 Tax=Phytophthora kernoviae TaxID=325452 RepID=A0A3F2RT24_9STRA|nr:hypothetical protein BBP00_00003939 [Phytophthora kernoviae]RLN64680.1 hypothetical protein BBJ29_005656 [Phytophthora kernoviae]
MPLTVRAKRSLFACFAFAAYIAWALGAWEAILIRTGIRPKLRPVLLLAGDSLTEKGTNPKSMGWVTQLQHDYTRSADVVHRGLSGYNTRWYLEYSMPIIESEIASGIYTPTFITWRRRNLLEDGLHLNTRGNKLMYEQLKDKIQSKFSGTVAIMWAAGAWDAIFDGSAVTPKLRSVLLLTGDSLTEKGTEPETKGWVTRLQDEYRRAADVIPRGLGGYNTRWYLKYAIPTLEKEILSGVYTPTFVTVWFGANDAALPNGSSYEQHVPREIYKQNLVKIVNAFKAMAPKAGILLITPPHVDDAARLELSMDLKDDKHGVIDRTNAMAGKYAQACVETAETMGVPVLDLYSYFNNMSEWERDELLSDGLHLNLKGNKLIL